MAHVNEMIESKYLKQADFPDPLIVTIKAVRRLNIAKEGDTPEYKWAIKYAEFDKPMLLNSTNIKALEKACGSGDTDEWTGKEVIVYNDENVSFGGQVTGGLRIRKQQEAPKKVQAKPLQSDKSLAEQDDDIPF
jgi:hypothetical protein